MTTEFLISQDPSREGRNPCQNTGLSCGRHSFSSIFANVGEMVLSFRMRKECAYKPACFDRKCVARLVTDVGDTRQVASGENRGALGLSATVKGNQAEIV